MQQQQQKEEQNEFIGFNIYECIYHIKKEILENSEENMLKRMVFGFIPSEKDEKGRYLLHFNSQSFHWILHYLEKKELPNKLKQEELNEIDVLADYLSIKSLQDYIKKLNKEKENIKEFPKLISCIALNDKKYRNLAEKLVFGYHGNIINICIVKVNGYYRIYYEDYDYLQSEYITDDIATNSILLKNARKLAVRYLQPELIEEYKWKGFKDLKD